MTTRKKRLMAGGGALLAFFGLALSQFAAAASVNDHVLGQWSDGYWYPAWIKKISGNKATLRFDDGDTAEVTAAQLAPIDWDTDSSIECKVWAKRGSYIPVRVLAGGKTIIAVGYGYGEKESLGVGSCRSKHATTGQISLTEQAAPPVYKAEGGDGTVSSEEQCLTSLLRKKLDSETPKHVCDAALDILGNNNHCAPRVNLTQPNDLPRLALPFVQAAAQLGEARCTSIAGDYHDYGVVVARDRVRARQHYLQALKMFAMEGKNRVWNQKQCDVRGEHLEFEPFSKSASIPHEAYLGLMRTTAGLERDLDEITGYPYEVWRFWSAKKADLKKEKNSTFETGFGFGRDSLTQFAGICAVSSGCRVHDYGKIPARLTCGQPGKENCSLFGFRTDHPFLKKAELSVDAPPLFTEYWSGRTTVHFDQDSRLVGIGGGVQSYEVVRKALLKYGKPSVDSRSCQPKQWIPPRSEAIPGEQECTAVIVASGIATASCTTTRPAETIHHAGYWTQSCSALLELSGRGGSGFARLGGSWDGMQSSGPGEGFLSILANKEMAQ